MGIFDASSGKTQTQTIEIHRQSWRDGEMVVVRVRTTSDDEQWVTNQLLKRVSSVRGGLSTYNQLALADKLWLERLIVSWTLTKDEQALPLTAESIALLPKEDRDFMMKHIWERQPERPVRISLSRPRTQRDFQSAVQMRNEQFQRIEK